MTIEQREQLRKELFPPLFKEAIIAASAWCEPDENGKRVVPFQLGQFVVRGLTEELNGMLESHELDEQGDY